VTLVAITQRVEVAHHGERRDALDQRWGALLAAADLTPLVVPNRLETAQALIGASGEVAGVVLTGGNDLVEVGGDAPERDATEHWLLDEAARRGWPVLGVCRGMQLMLQRCGATLERVEGHVAPSQQVFLEEGPRAKNSYHHWGVRRAAVPPAVSTWAWSEDEVVKAAHFGADAVGIMWHPERLAPFHDDDVALLRSLFRP
jgi:gamma-glutamyl-gamma-aminobutyrate hydrolase PuuD